jgi:hypothetical protein
MWQRVFILVAMLCTALPCEVSAQSGPPVITNLSRHGMDPVTISSTTEGYDADIGVWPGTATFGCTFLFVDIDVRDGGTLTGKYTVQQSPFSDSYMDIYLLEPGVTWDPGTTWNESGTERCFRTDFPAGVVRVEWPVDAWDYQPEWVTPEFALSVPLTAYAHQSVRVVFRQWSWGAVYDEAIQSRIRSLSVGAPPSFTVSPPRLDLSTGDANRLITTTANPATTQFTPTFTAPLQSNPNSACAAALNFSQNGGTGSVNTTVTASPPDCSGIFDPVRAHVESTESTNSTKVVVPPQIMIKMVVGEAGGQPGDADQQSILVSARNRFGDSAFPGGTAQTWQAVLIPSQYYGASNGTTDGPDQELRNSAQVFTGEIADIVGGSKCYWSPTNTQWANVQAALDSGTKKFPSATGAPGCWQSQTRQIVYKASIGVNISGGPSYNAAPAFVFLRLRPDKKDPAVIQID